MSELCAEKLFGKNPQAIKHRSSIFGALNSMAELRKSGRADSAQTERNYRGKASVRDIPRSAKTKLRK